MSVTTLRATLAARPFRPFVIHVADQRTFEVPQPEFVSIGPKNQTLIIWDEDERARILDMLMITGVDVPGADA